jgi:hypothetical protein
MPIIFVKGSYFETPLYTMCRVTSRTVIRTNYEKGGGAEGGEGEIQGVKG